ncbi:MAG: radical SAM protein [candidate division Zixibacteria bacterium]|nr:radical SAM protein [candidate division Zixibacteria bacterium]
MRTLLLFPPHCFPYQPWCTLPILKAYLQSRGIDVAQRDLNIETYHFLTSREYLGGTIEMLQHARSALEAKRKLSTPDQKRLLDIFKALALSSTTIEEIEEAKNTLRDPKRFYNFSNLSYSKKILENAFGMISMAHFPSEITKEYFTVDFNYTDLDNLIQATEDTNSNPFIKVYDTHTIDSLVDRRPRIIGISLSLQEQVLPGLTLSRMLKKRFPNIIIVLGGYITTKVATRLASVPEFFKIFADFGIVGEGERPLLALIRALASGEDLASIPGLLFTDGNKVLFNSGCDYVDMNELPTPDYQGFPLELYLSPFPILALGSSRGCYWGKCAFCDRGEIGGIHYRRREAKHVVNDLEHLSKTFQTQYFSFTDEAISPSSLEQISEEIIKRNLRVRLATDVRFEKKFKPELCDKISKAGFVHLRFGLESASDRVLSLMRKNTDNSTITKVLSYFSQAGVCTHLYIFFGFPGENKADAQRTIDFVIRNKDLISSACATTFGLLEGSPIFACPNQYGIRIVDSGNGKLFKFFYDFESESGMSVPEAKGMEKEFIAAIRQTFEDFDVWGYLEWGHTFLYNAKYGHKGLLTLVKNKKRSNSDNSRFKIKVDDACAPKLIDQICFYESQYDLAEISENIKNRINKEAVRRKSHILFDSVNYRFISLNHNAAEIIKLLDGDRNIGQVSRILADRYRVPSNSVQEEVVSFLANLRKERVLLDNRMGEEYA